MGATDTHAPRELPAVARCSELARKNGRVVWKQERFRSGISDFSGDLSARVEGELKREPIADADAECPRCGSRRWVLIERRAEPEEPFTRWRALACARCGATNGWQSAGRVQRGREWRGDSDDESVPGLPDNPTAKDIARVARFGVLAMTASPTLQSYSYIEGEINAVTLADGLLEITTEIPPQVLYGPAFKPTTPDVRARDRLERSLSNGHAVVDRRLSQPAQQLAFAEDVRRAEGQAAAAEPRDAAYTIDGTSHTFVVLETAERWAAAAETADRLVTLSGEGIPAAGIALRTLQAPQS